MLNKWEQAIVDSLRYATHNGQSVTITAAEVHIPMNAMEKYAEVRDVIADIPIDRLREVCAAERDGRCVVLPDCSKCVYQQNGNMSLACSNCIGEQKFDNDLFTPEAAKAALAKEGGRDV